MAKPAPTKEEQRLLVEILSCRDDPLKFVMFAFPWGTPGTPLAGDTGPHSWQRKVLADIRDHIAENRNRMVNGKPPQVFRLAVASGRGIGKSALVSWLILWSLSTQPGTTVLVTANTETQLKTRTWAELGRWHTLAINSHWFERDTVKIVPAEWLVVSLKKELKVDSGYYYGAAQTWTEDNPDAFAGIHNRDHGFTLIMDEASGIPDAIFKVASGFFTDLNIHRYWFCFSNPRQNTGPFYECFHKNRNEWRTLNVDARTVGGDTAEYDRIIREHGEDSDVARVEVKGEFPETGATQFIGSGLVRDAAAREVEADAGAPVVIGVDVARFGDDCSVIYVRAGRDGRSIAPIRFKGLATDQLVHHVASVVSKYQPDAVCVDGGGVGGGVVDQLRGLGYRVHDIQFGARADEDQRYQNKRAEMWGRMKEWLAYGAVPEDKHLFADLTNVQYEFDATGRLKLESKEKMKARGQASPDAADALALTFAVYPPRRDLRGRRGRAGRVARDVDYSVLG